MERLIGTIRREYLDRMFFWNALDLERKLEAFRNYYGSSRKSVGRFQGSASLKGAWVLGFGTVAGHGNLA